MQLQGIQIWGDSLFRGVQYDEKRKRHVITAKPPVDMAAKMIPVPIKNHARMGNTILKGFQGFQTVKEERFENELILLEFGGNDCDFKWSEVAEDPDKEHTCNVPPALYRETLLKMIDSVKLTNGIPVLTTLPPLNAEKYFDWITRDGLNKKNILAFLGDVQQIYRWQEYYSLMNLRIALEKGLLCLPIREYFLSFGHQKEWMCEDGIHPNEVGYRSIYEVFMKQWNLAAPRFKQ